MKTGKSFFLIILFLCGGLRVNAGILQFVPSNISRQQYTTWVPVEADSQMIRGGKTPYFDVERDTPVFTLNSDEYTLITVPAYKNVLLKCFSPWCSPDFSVSEGTGLFTPFKGSIQRDGFIQIPLRKDKTCLLRIKSASKTTFAIYLPDKKSRALFPVERTLLMTDDTRHIFTIEEMEKEARISRAFYKMDISPLSFSPQGPALVIFDILPIHDHQNSLTYTFEALGGGAKTVTLDLTSFVDHTQLRRIDGRLLLTGKKRRLFLSVPGETETLTVKTTTPVFIRAESIKKANYLFPGQNKPNVNDNFEQLVELTNKTEKSDAEMENPTTPSKEFESSLDKITKRAFRMARNNALRERGIAALALMSSAETHSGQEKLEKKSSISSLKRSSLYYKSIYPVEVPGDGFIRHANFKQYRMKESEEESFYFYPDQVEEMADSIHSGIFTHIPPGKKADYRLPHSVADRKIRLTVHMASDSESGYITLLPKGYPAERIEIVPEHFEAKMNTSDVRLAESCLRRPEMICADPGKHFTGYQSTISLIKTGSIEINLPADVDFFSVFAPETTSFAPVEVALSVLTSKRFKISEEEYLQIGSNLSKQQIVKTLLKLTQTPAFHSEQSRLFLLESHLFPLARDLKSGAQQFKKKIPPAPPVSETPSLTQGKAMYLASLARKAEKSKDLIRAFEYWGKLSKKAPRDKTRNEALLKRSTLLLTMGEHSLGEKALLQIYGYNKNRQLRQRAFSILEAYYGSQEMSNTLKHLYSYRLLKEGDSRVLDKLGLLYLKRGYYSFALSLAMMVPDKKRSSVYTLLMASLQNGWFQTFERTVSALSKKKDRSLWRGISELFHGNGATAQIYFSQAGSKGEEWSDYIEEGQKLFNSFKAANEKSRRADLIQKWEEHSLSYPGPRIWKTSSLMPLRGGSFIEYYNISSDLYVPMLKGELLKKDKFIVQGPAFYKFLIRPLLLETRGSHLTEWITIDLDGKKYRVPLDNKTPSSDLSIVGAGNLKIGATAPYELYIGPGKHSLSLYSEDLDYAYQIKRLVPTIQFPGLPALTAESFKKISETGLSSYLKILQCREKACIIILNKKNTWKGITLQRQFQSIQLPETELGAEKKIEDNKTACDVKSEFSFSRLSETRAPSLEIPLDRMRCLYWRWSQSPEKLPFIIADAEELFFKNRGNRAAKKYLSLMRKKARWRRIFGLESAGVTRVKIQGWSPMNPTYRIYKSLISSFFPEEYLMYGYAKLVWRVNNTKRTSYTFTFSSDHIEFMEAVPLTISYRVGNNEKRSVTITPGMKKTIRLELPEGKSSIRMKIENPRLFQFAKVIVSTESPLQERGKSVQSALKNVHSREYDLTTEQEPVRFQIEGPKWLRIDRLTSKLARSSFLKTGKGLQEIVVKPEGGEKTTLVRVFKKEAGKRPELPGREKIITSPAPLQTPSLRLTAFTLPSPVFPDVSLPQPAQPMRKEGTWLLRTSLQRRKNIQDLQAENNTETFEQTKVGYSFFNKVKKYYYRFEGLARIREQNSKLIGLSFKFFQMLPEKKVSATISGSFYEQSGETSLFLRGKLSQKYVVTKKNYHRPFLSFFVRKLSLNDFGNYSKSFIDRDIFTKYKRDHKYGVTLGNTLAYKPFIDVLLRTGFKVRSNELERNIVDNVHAFLSWDQLVMPVTGEIRFTSTSYLPDKHRKNLLFRNAIQLTVKRGKILKRGSRLEAGLRLKQEFETGATSGFIFFGWYFSEHTLYGDQLNKDIGFTVLRKYFDPNTIQNGEERSAE